MALCAFRRLFTIYDLRFGCSRATRVFAEQMRGIFEDEGELTEGKRPKLSYAGLSVHPQKRMEEGSMSLGTIKTTEKMY